MKQQHININRTSYTEYSGDQEVYALHLTVGSVDKKVIDNIASEKRILLGILTDKANKSAEYVKAQQIEWKLGQEYRALQQKEQD